MLKKLCAETIGTLALVFAGTGAIVVNELTGGAVSHVGVALTFGLVVMAMVYTIGDISGAHLNPAVTLGFWASRRLEPALVLPYIGSQLMGAFIASLSLRFIFPGSGNLGATQPFGSAGQALLLEAVMTWLLMFVILGVSVGAHEKGTVAGIAVGAVIALEALFGGPISGASMNPARSIAPAIVSGNVDDLWLYIVAPIGGALIAVVSCRAVREKGCCTTSDKDLPNLVS